MKIFTSKTLQSYANWASKPSVTKKINNYLPTVQSTYAVACYGFNVQKTRDIPQDKKNSMLIHDVACGGVGLGLSAWLTNLSTRFKMNIIENLKKDKNMKKDIALANGVGIAIPIFITTLIMRGIIPILATYLSPKIEKLRQKMKNKNQNKNVENNWQQTISAKQKYGESK